LATRKVSHYSAIQVTLHWVVVFLVAFQFVAHGGIEEAWTSVSTGGNTRPPLLAFLHIVAGTLILFLALLRIYLRRLRGVPEAPADDPKVLQVLAEAVHFAIYALLLMMPVSGAAAWFFVSEGAAVVHRFLQNVLLGVIAIHVVGALFQHFVRRSDVLIRMFRAGS
jgi:cytochrome b561